VDDSPADYERRDEVRDAAERFPGVTYIRHERNLGACRARNTALGLARGEYIALLDDDDEWLPEKLARQTAALAASDAALVYNNYYQIDDDTGRERLVELPAHTGNVYRDLLVENFIGSCSFPMVRAQALRAVGGFDETLPSCQDWDAWLRIARRYPVTFLPEPLCVYHAFHGENISGKAYNKVDGFEKILMKYRADIVADRDLYWRHLIRLAPMYGWNRQVKKALSAWLKAVTMRPLRVRENALNLICRVVRQGYRRIRF
jgi:Glycosyltransferases, probably involved in cell wall biogenesis